MSNSFQTANMNLTVPVVGVDPGPDWANGINASLIVIDNHNHSAGSGVPIKPSGLNINSDLPFNNNNLTLGRSFRFYPQIAALSDPADIGCLYESGVDLYYNDGLGNQVRITQSGAVSGASGTITGLPSGTASASYGTGVFTFQSATNTGANIDGASFVLRNNITNSKGLTLSPPNAMAANYGLVLPSLPGVQSIMTLDSSGNMSAPYTVDNSSITIDSNIIEVKTGGIIQAMLATRPTGTTVAAGGVAVSSSSGTFNSTNTNQDITNLSITITTTGRPVMLQLQPDGSGNNAYIGITTTAQTAPGGEFFMIRGSTNIGRYLAEWDSNSSVLQGGLLPPSVISMVDVVAAGTYTYKVQSNPGSGSAVAFYCVLVAYEI